MLTEFKFLQAAYQLRKYFTMVQYKETIMKMEPCYSGSIVTQVSVSKALQLFTVTKDDGMVLNQAVNLQV